MQALGGHATSPPSEPGIGKHRVPTCPACDQLSTWVPTTDIFAQGDDLVIRVELAGVDPTDIELRFANGVLTVSGDRSPEFRDDADEPKFYVRERFYGEFRRSITLPDGTTPEQIQAAFDDGLVEIVIAGAVKQADSTRIELRDRSTGATRRSLS